MNKMTFTGERMVPEGADSTTFWEHIYRYRFALPYARGQSVIDIACGEGYGTAALLRGGARTVLGIDISAEACAHASARYGIETKQGDALKIPAENASVDVIVSFETIEHLVQPEAFLEECRRVLRPEGTLVISTPNRDLYREQSPNNKFHCSELSTDEFVAMFDRLFKDTHYFSQRPQNVPLFDPRGIIDDRWPLRKIRGVGRIGIILQYLFCPQLRRSLATRWFRDPIAAILFEPSGIGKMFDRYSILPGTIESARHALYTVAVGHV